MKSLRSKIFRKEDDDTSQNNNSNGSNTGSGRYPSSPTESPTSTTSTSAAGSVSRAQNLGTNSRKSNYNSSAMRPKKQSAQEKFDTLFAPGGVVCFSIDSSYSSIPFFVVM